MQNITTIIPPPSLPNTPWLRKAEIAQYYKCDIRTITNLMRRQILPYVKIGRLVRFHQRDCDVAMEKFHRRGGMY
jgi:excisionase family DNA binding protein